MQALVFDKSKYSWENSKGFEKVEVPEPVINEKNNPPDRQSVVIKVHYAGVCGSDRGIWYRQAFKDQILGSIDEASPLPNPPHQGEGKKNKNSSPPLVGGVREGGGKAYRIIGHEFSGEIVELGKEAAQKYKLKKGDFVSCESHVVCNECYQCLRGQKNVCTNEKILGISHDGGFAQYVKVPGHIVWKTDKTKIRPEIAAIQEPFGNAVHAASQADLKGQTLAIFGLGPIGLFTVLVAQGLGAKTIIGIEPNPVTRKMAQKLGIDYVIGLSQTNTDSTQAAMDQTPLPRSLPTRGREGRGKKGEEKKDKKHSPPPVGGVRGGGDYQHNAAVIDEIMKITKGIGVDVGLEMSGFNSSLNNVIAATRRGGEVILFGLKNGDFVLEDYNKLIVKGQTFHAVIGRQIWQTWETTRKLLEDPTTKIQEKIFNIVLNQGQDTILPFSGYTPERFEKMMIEHPKFLLQF